MKITISLEFYPNFIDKMYLIDVASVCNERKNSKEEPMLEIFDRIIQNLQDFGIPLTEIKGFSDSSFKYHVDDKNKYFQYIEQELIIEMPGGIKADKGILAYCLKHDNALFISQDLMREYYKFLPNNSWILEKRISILVVDNEIYLIPMLKALFQDFEAKKRVKITTLDVIKNIENSEKNKKWDIFPN